MFNITEKVANAMSRVLYLFKIFLLKLRLVTV